MQIKKIKLMILGLLLGQCVNLSWAASDALQDSAAARAKIPARTIYFAKQKKANFIEKVVRNYHMNPHLLHTWLDALQPDMRVLKLMDPSTYYTDYTRPHLVTATHSGDQPSAWFRYRERLVTSKRVATGSSFAARHKTALKSAYERFGVAPNVILGILGIETLYGKYTGKFPVFSSLATLAFYFPRRSDFFSQELEEFLVLSRKLHQLPTTVKGSYAGALGLSQFMPSAYHNYAVSFQPGHAPNLFEGNDAVVSIANYLKGKGWKKSESVVKPIHLTATQIQKIKSAMQHSSWISWTDVTKKVPSLKTLVVSHSHSSVETPRGLLLFDGKKPYSWLTFHNFDVIMRYNPSLYYSMAVYEFSQAVKPQLKTHHLHNLA